MSSSLFALTITFLLKTPNVESATLHLQKKSWYTSPPTYPHGVTHSMFPKLNFWASHKNRLLFFYSPILLIDYSDLDFTIWKHLNHLELCLLLRFDKWSVINPINSTSVIELPLRPNPSLQFRVSWPLSWATAMASLTVLSASVSRTCLQVWVNYHSHYISLLCSQHNPPDIVHHLIPTYLSKHSFHYFSSYTLSKLHTTCMIYHLQCLAHNSLLSSCCLFGQVHLSIIPITCHPLMPQSYVFFGPNKNVTLGLH